MPAAALAVVGIGWALYYYFACESGSGQTVGKRAMNIRVVRIDGAPAGMREIGMRTVLRLIDGLFLYLRGSGRDARDPRAARPPGRPGRRDDDRLGRQAGARRST